MELQLWELVGRTEIVLVCGGRFGGISGGTEGFELRCTTS